MNGHTTEFMTFRVRAGKEARAREWMALLKARQRDCVATLARERMRFESIFAIERDGRLHLSWLSVQGDGGASPKTSEHEIDRLHMAFWRECIDDAWTPETHEHVVDFVPDDVAATMFAASEVDAAHHLLHREGLG
jgi:hypothetical protein